MDPVLLTRPQADSERWVRRLRDATAARVIVSPLLEIVPRGALPDWTGGLVFTSANAVRIYTDVGGRSGLAAWCVGPRTATLAAEAGLDVRGTAPDAAALVEMVADDAPPLLHLRGAIQRGDLSGELQRRGIEASDAVIYAAEPRALSAEAMAALRAGPIAVPLFSPRSAALFFAACPAEVRPHLKPVCLSAAVAEELPDLPVIVAERPDGAALFEALVNLLRMKGG